MIDPKYDSLENFRDENGKLYLVRCPRCGMENYAPAVISGQCVWCGWKDGDDICTESAMARK
jgi:ribosomal protein L37E